MKGLCGGDRKSDVHDETENSSNKKENACICNAAEEIKSHKVIIAQAVIAVVGVAVDVVLPGRDDGNLRLGRFALLVPLIGRALLAHLLIARRSERTSNLLDITRRHLLHQLPDKILRPQTVVRLLGVRRQQRDKHLAHFRKLVLGRRLEQWHGTQVNRISRIRRVRHDNGLGRAAFAVQIDVPDQILRVLEIRVLLRSAQALAPLGLVFADVQVVFVDLFSPLLPVLFYPLRLGLLVGCGLGFRGGFGLGGFLGFLALDFRVFSCVPGIENLFLVGVMISVDSERGRIWFLHRHPPRRRICGALRRRQGHYRSRRRRRNSLPRLGHVQSVAMSTERWDIEYIPHFEGGILTERKKKKRKHNQGKAHGVQDPGGIERRPRQQQ